MPADNEPLGEPRRDRTSPREQRRSAGGATEARTAAVTIRPPLDRRRRNGRPRCRKRTRLRARQLSDLEGNARAAAVGTGFLPARGWTVVQSGTASGAARAIAANRPSIRPTNREQCLRGLSSRCPSAASSSSPRSPHEAMQEQMPRSRCARTPAAALGGARSTRASTGSEPDQGTTADAGSSSGGSAFHRAASSHRAPAEPAVRRSRAGHDLRPSDGRRPRACDRLRLG